jgi:hypothetical protein
MIGHLLAMLIVIYPQTDADAPPTCPETRPNVGSDMFGFVRCKSTEADVEAKFGRPLRSATPNCDSYEFPNGSLATFFFTPDGLLLTERLYAEPAPNR